MRRIRLSSASLVRKTLCVGAIALIAVTAACSRSGNNPAGPSPVIARSVVSTTGGSDAVPRSVTGTLNGRFDFTRTWGDQWWEFYSDSDTTGTLSHFGLARMYTTHIPTLALALTQGTFRIVAANGDEINGTYEGSATYDETRSDVVHGVATFVITGGTGRFLGATGTINASFLETLDDPTWASAKAAWTLSGTVNY